MNTDDMTLDDLARELPHLRELARLLWGDETETLYNEKELTEMESKGSYLKQVAESFRENPIISMPKWEWKLKAMLVSEDPVKYLRENM